MREEYAIEMQHFKEQMKKGWLFCIKDTSIRKKKTKISIHIQQIWIKKCE